ncbi:60S ribosomal protein subunit export [Kluyveromyces marxianus]|nr:60S ribosomal protein subunit export [Kluyveromyces marxianus]KAG0683440.1 60S ribosomal protein subunit export [Kluyveromyces marxianus]
MAKKPISKHSRAARRSEAAEPEAKALETLPRAEKTDFAATLIRTANKNEALLEAKIQKRGHKNKKKNAGRVSKQLIDDSSLTSRKAIRALNITSRLDGKREKAIHRAKYVQSARKAGWDTTNQSIRKELSTLQNAANTVSDSVNKGTDKEGSANTEDAMIEDDQDHIEIYDNAKSQEVQEKAVSTTYTASNVFTSLEDEIEA